MPTAQTRDMKTIFRDALKALDEGRLAVAIAGFRAILADQPDLAEAQFQLGRALCEMGDGDAARVNLEAALTRHPKEVAIWVEFALLTARTQPSGGARSVSRRAKAAGLSAQHCALLGTLAAGKGLRASTLGGAKPAALKATKAKVAPLAALAQRHPKGALVLAHLGQAQQAAGNLRAAAEAFHQATKIEPLASDLHHSLALVCEQAGRLPQGQRAARKAHLLAPLDGSKATDYARLCLLNGDTESALRVGSTVAKRSAQLRRVMAQAAMARGRPLSALDWAGPDGDPKLRADALALAGQSEAALAVFDQIRKAAPEDIVTATLRAQLLQSMNHAQAAEADLRALLETDPDNGLAWRALAYGTKLSPDGPEVQAMEDRLQGPGARMIHYALARVHQGTGREWPHLHAANAASFEAFPYVPSVDQAEVSRLTGVVTEVLPKVAATQIDAAPIFVTGLPRSGTTLIEQILASHPDVEGGGEMGVLQHALETPIDIAAAGFAPDLRAAGHDYLDAVAERLPTAKRFTDKSIHTFTTIGLVHKMLPKARVVVVRRDPRDVGLSIYRNFFRDGTHRYANDLGAIAKHCGLFHRMVEHWRVHVPDAFHEISYEDLLADPEGQTRTLLQACDLPWDPACLSFHTATRRVDTLSFAQVRKPLYATSKGGWRAHEAELAPLIEGLATEGVPLP